MHGSETWPMKVEHELKLNHKWCSGVKGSLHNANQSSICGCCNIDRPITDGLNTDLHLDISNEKVDKFCYLGDFLDADGGCDSAGTDSQSEICLEMFREYLPIPTGKGFLLKLLV